MRCRKRGSFSRQYTSQSSSEFKANEYTCRSAMTGNHDFARCSLPEIARQIILHFGEGDFFKYRQYLRLSELCEPFIRLRLWHHCQYFNSLINH